ncbi:MAG: DUF3106 domain-containing protein [Sterolibacterium sp.]|jgi:hypothetical protein
MARPLLAIVSAVSLVLVLALALVNPADAAIIPPLKQPKWVELSPQQREVLAPLSGEWDKLESYRRKKWLGIAQRYPTLSVEEQQRLQRRMKAWISLSPEDRKRAREQYKTLQKAPPEQRQTVKQRWQEYESLPDAEKQRLQQDAKQKPQPKSGAGKIGKSAPASIAKPAVKSPETSVTPPAGPIVAPSSVPPSASPTTEPRQ